MVTYFDSIVPGWGCIMGVLLTNKNNMKVVGILVVIVVLLGGIYLFNAGSDDSAQDNHNDDAMMEGDNQMTGDGETFTGSLKALVALGKEYQCTFSQETDQATSDGTVYISGENIRGDFTSTVSVGGGFAVESHMIKKGNTLYTWSPLSSQGFQIEVDENDDAEVSAEANAALEVQNQELEYNCKPYNVNASLFETPSDIEFTVLGEAMAQ